MRPASDNVVRWLLADRLGSMARAVRADGTVDGEQRYMPYGLERYDAGAQKTVYRFTGQRIEDAADLYFYKSRWYDPVVGRFLQADTVVPEPGNPQSLNRYAYVNNNPLRYTDPSGRYVFEDDPTDVHYIIPPHWNPTDQAVGVVHYDDIAELDPVSPGEFLAVITLPYQGAMLAVVGEALVADAVGFLVYEVGVPAVQTFLLKMLEALGVACADGDCTNEGRSVWQLNPWARGNTVEDMLGRNPFLARNFPVIDRFANGVATSIKSVDLQAVSYQNIGTLTRTVQRYVSNLANWQGTKWGDVVIESSEIMGRELLLAIPLGATPAQMAALQQIQHWAQTVGVTLNIVVMP